MVTKSSSNNEVPDMPESAIQAKSYCIDPRYTPPSAAQIERWLAWSASALDSDAGTLSDERGD